MLILVAKGRSTGGFFLRRQAKKGKVPPLLTGCNIGGYPCILMHLYGPISKNNSYLAPYLRRGDTLISETELANRFPFNPLVVQTYKQRQCLNFCLAALQYQQQKQVALIDKEGDSVGVAAELTAVCNTVWVVTNRPELFLPCTAYTREMFGTQPLITQTLPPVDLIIAPDGLEGASPPAKGIVASPDGLLYPKDRDVYLPPSVQRATPGGFDPLTVTAGLFTAFYPKELMESVPAAIHLGNQVITPKELW